MPLLAGGGNLRDAKECLSQALQKLDENQGTIASNQQASFPIQTMYKPYSDYNQLFSNLIVSLFCNVMRIF